MTIDPQLFKQLLETFKTELDEQLQIITDGLLNLEKNPANSSLIETVFRSAHNIKGAARSLGITQIGDIAHRVETIFSGIKNNTIQPDASIINVCLDAVDKMHVAMQSFLDNKELPFDMNKFILSLDINTRNPLPDDKNEQIEKITNKPVMTDSKSTDTIRISINHIDRVNALLEEMQVTKISLDDHYDEMLKMVNKINQLDHNWVQLNTLLHSIDKNDQIQRLSHVNTDYVTDIFNSSFTLSKDMHNRMNEFSILLNSLQEEVRMLRLIPAEHLLCMLPRYVRDIAQELNKQVEITINDAGVKMDKLMLESLKDPILHILRNAIDHGIENEATRKAANKSAIGHIDINIKEEGDHITILIKDDGAGIDLNKITTIALNKNVITPTEAESMSDEDKLELIFNPGFTTKEIITDVSGRGVGLDVVKANLLSIKGKVSIDTEVGKGTTFCLQVPLTLASERGVLVRTGNTDFVIPTADVDRVLSIRAKDIIEVEGTQAILLYDHAVPLRSLTDLLNLDNTSERKEELAIVVIRNAKNVVALVVDEVVGEKEIVIKSLQAFLAKLPIVRGGTLSGNNKVIMVLNTVELMNLALSINKPASIIQVKNEKSTTKEKPHILVVDDSITTRTLEKNILESNNFNVTVAVNGQEAWDLLQKQAFKLLITDVSMPIMDGFTLTEKVKKSDKTQDLPVIIVTSLGSDEEKQRGIDAGANAYIIKNEFESDTLLEIVNQLV